MSNDIKVRVKGGMIISYLELLSQDNTYFLLVSGGIFIVFTLILFLLRNNKTEQYHYLINLIKDDLKTGLKKLDRLKDIKIKEDLLLEGKKDLTKQAYEQVKQTLITDQFLKELLSEMVSQDLEKRKKAGLTLLEIRTPQAIDYVISLLYDDNQELSNLIIKELAKVNTPRVTTILFNRLNSCDNLTTLLTLKEIFLEKGNKIVPQLLEVIDSNSKTHILKLVIEVLGEINNQRAIDYLINLLYHQEVEVRIEAAKSLAKFDNQKAFKTLLSKVDDDSCNVRAQIVKLLGQSNNSKVIPHLYQALKDDSGIVRNNATLALIDLGKEGIKSLILALENDVASLEITRVLDNIEALKLIEATKELYYNLDKDANPLRIMEKQRIS